MPKIVRTTTNDKSVILEKSFLKSEVTYPNMSYLDGRINAFKSVKNFARNGDFGIVRRMNNPTTGSINLQSLPTSATNKVYVADGWMLLTNTQSCGPADYAGSVSYKNITADDIYNYRELETSTRFISFAGRFITPRVNSNKIYLTQFIDNINLFSGRQMTLSFKTRGTILGNVAVEIVKYTSSSASVVIASKVFEINTIIQKQYFTFDFPTVSQLEYTKNDSALAIRIHTSSGLNPVAGSMINYQGTLDFTQLQLEYGNTATEFDFVSEDIELNKCNRYYENSFSKDRYGFYYHSERAQVDADGYFSYLVRLNTSKIRSLSNSDIKISSNKGLDKAVNIVNNLTTITIANDNLAGDLLTNDRFLVTSSGNAAVANKTFGFDWEVDCEYYYS